MEDLATITAPVETPSTVIDTQTETGPSGGGAPRVLADDKAPSLRDTIASVVKEEDAANAKDEPKDDKPKVEPDPKKVEDVKPATDRAADGKFAAKPKEGEAAEAPAGEAPQPATEAEKADAKHYPEPPKSFQADSRELYRNVPRPVRRDIDIMVRENEAFREQATKATERYESIRPFDELARSNGRDLRESLVKINEVENAIKRDPVFGLNELLKEIGPRKQDGSPISIYELAGHVAQMAPHEFQQRMQGVQASQPAPVDPRVADTERQLADAREQLVTMQVIEPFKAEHPRYDELQNHIAAFLNSAMIPTSLSAPERLEMAYVMAERVVPPSAQAFDDDPAPAPTPPSRAADSLSGSKSIKSAPGAVSNDMEPERGGSIADILRDEAKKMRQRA